MILLLKALRRESASEEPIEYTIGIRPESIALIEQTDEDGELLVYIEEREFPLRIRGDATKIIESINEYESGKT
jgi:hypothetical protein